VRLRKLGHAGLWQYSAVAGGQAPDEHDVRARESELREVVEGLTGSPEVGSWRCDLLHEAVASATVGIWRVHADGWSVVLKLVGHGERGHPNWQAGDRPEHWYYWRREVLAYQSGLLSSLSGGLRAPTCYFTAEGSDSHVALWIEDLEGASPATRWPLAQYGRASRHLGQGQGEFVAGRPLPEHQWLSRSWLRSYLAQRDADISLLDDPAAWATPLVRQWLPEDLARPLMEMRRDQELFLSALERIPQTLCHLDLHPANMFGGEDETVLIDWSFVGIGALGEDAGNLVPDSVLDFHISPERVDDLYERVFEGCLAGLRDAGWTGSGDIVELAMRATIAAKYAWIAPAMLRAAVDRRESLNRRPIQETFAAWAPVIPFLTRCADHARRLIAAAAQP
jgi:hypothetical protein